MARQELTSRPRRALSAEERAELFREFKLGLIALSALVVLVVTLCWDRGEASGGRGRARDNSIEVAWVPGGQGGSSPNRGTVEDENARRDREAERDDGSRRGEVERDEGQQPPAPDRGAEPQRDRPREPVREPVREPERRTYMVKRNDTLWGIAKHELGDGRLYTLIRDANPKCRKTLRPGMVLLIPSPPGRALGSASLVDGGSAPGRLTLQSPDR